MFMHTSYCVSRTPSHTQTHEESQLPEICMMWSVVPVTSTNPFIMLGCAAAVRAIDEAGCDSITKRRVREVHELPGALWQIYDAHDADKIRDFLNKVSKVTKATPVYSCLIFQQV